MDKSTTKKLVTHDGSFHADDIFAAATLILYLEKNSKEFSAQGGPASGWEIIRTRDEETIKAGDYVFDVGGVYDPEQNRFDHHQPGGAGKHANGMEYASFGLVWKHYGEKLAGSKEAWQIIDDKLASPIDAGDNGINLVELTSEVKPYFVQSAFYAFHPRWEDTTMETLYAGFMETVKVAKNILEKEIRHASDVVEVEALVKKIYENTTDKRIIVFDKKYPYENTFARFPEPVFVVYPRTDGFFGVRAERKDINSFDNKKDFPKSWAGLRDEELQKISGVSDAVFCHRALFLAVAKTRGGAIELAKKALAS